jgi:hypothetical protein
MTELAQAVAAIHLHEPDHARARPSRYFKADHYGKVFSTKVPIDLYVSCALLRKRTESYLQTAENDRMHRNNLLFYVLMAVVPVKFKTPRASVKTLAGMKIAEFDDKDFANSLALVRPIYQKFGTSDVAAKGPDIVTDLKKVLSSQFGKQKKGT